MTAGNPYSYTIPGHTYVGNVGLRQRVVRGVMHEWEHFLIIGGRRCGKTSTLRVLKTDLANADPYPPSLVPVDLSAVVLDSRVSPGVLFRRILEVLTDGLSGFSWDAFSQEEEPFLAFLRHGETTVYEALANRYGPNWLAAIILDEVDALAQRLKYAGHGDAFFRYLRHLLQDSQMGHHFRLVATGSKGFSELFQHGSPLFNLFATLELGVLRDQDVDELVGVGFPGSMPGEAKDRLVELTGRHPYLLQGVLHRLWSPAAAGIYRDQVDSAAASFQAEHDDFHRWLNVFDDVAREVYGYLSARPDEKASRSSLVGALPCVAGKTVSGLDIDDALTVLVTHGVIEVDGENYRIAGRMFRDWFHSHAFGDSLPDDRDLVTIENFFDATNDYQVKRRLTNQACLLESKDHRPHYAVLNVNGSDGVSAALATRKERSEEAPLLFLIQPTSASEGNREHTEEAHRIKADQRIDVVPMELALMERALRLDTCHTTLSEAVDKYITRQDPYFESIPVTDPNLFFGRTAQLQAIPSLLAQGQHVGIFGLRKTGKTSLARQLQLRFNDIPVASISCQELDGYASSQVLLRIAEELRRELHDRFAIWDRSDANDDYSRQLKSLIAAWKGTGRSEPVVVILDEIDTLLPFGDPNPKYSLFAEGRKVFGVLRALAQELRGVVLLAIAYRPDINRINSLPANAGENPFFMGFHEVFSGSLAPDECDTMIRELGAWRGILWDPPALRRLYDYCGGHPFVARLFASEVCKRGQRKRITVDRVETIADEIQSTMRAHQIGAFYREVVGALRVQERELVQQIVSSSEPMAECQLLREQEQALTDLEHLGLVISSGAIQVSAKLFEHWARTRLEA